MKLLMFDFLCPSDGAFEELVKSDVKQIPCPKCGVNAVRQISPVRIDKYAMSLQDGASPTSVDYFDRIHRERKAIEERCEREHGDYGPAAGGDGGRGFVIPTDSDLS